MIYLDTHVVVWLDAGLSEKFSERARKLVNQDDLFISPVVRLELQYLYEIGRVTDDAHSIVASCLGGWANHRLARSRRTFPPMTHEILGPNKLFRFEDSCLMWRREGM